MLFPLILVLGQAAPAPELAWVSERTGRAHMFNVMDFGAVGDGVTKDTAAIVKAVDAVTAAGEGAILFPSGGRFLTAPFNVTSHCTLFIDANATLLGSTDFDDWPLIPALPSYGQGRDHPGPRRTSLIHGQNMSDVVITGANGTIDGQGAPWWDDHLAKTELHTRGHLIELMWSTDITLSNLTLTNSPFWTVHPVYCVGFTAHHLWIINPTNANGERHAPNTDGIDPDSTSDVLIHDVYIRTGDDAIAIKSGWDEYGYGYGVPSRNITIRDCVFSSPCCAAVCIGSEMSGGVSDVRISNSHLFESAEGLRIKAGAGRGGYVRDISIENVTMDGMKTAMQYNCKYGGHPADDPTHHLNLSALPDVRRIAARNVSGINCRVVADLVGLPLGPIADVTFEDVQFDGGKYECSDVSGTYRNMVPQPCAAISPA